MTVLKKPVSRRMERAEVFEAGKYRPVTVILYPNGLIGLRAKGLKTEYKLPIAKVYQMAVLATVQEKRSRL